MRSPGYFTSLRRISRNAKLFILVSSGVAFCFFGIFAVLYNLFLLRLGFGPVFIGLANGVVGLGFALSSFPAGIIGGRIGFRRAMTIGAGSGVVASALLPLALYLPDSLQGPWLVVFYGIFGCAVALILVNGVPFMMASSTDAERDHVFAAAAAAPALGGFAGSIVAGVLPSVFVSVSSYSLADSQPFGLSLWLAPLVYLVILLALRAMAPVARPVMPDSREAPGRFPLALILICSVIVLFRTSTYFAFTAFFNVYLDTVFGSTPARIGTLAALGRLSMVAGAMVSPLMVARWSRHNSAVILLVLLVLFAVVAGIFHSVPLIAVSLAGVSAGTAAMDAVFAVYSQRIIPRQHRGTMSGAVALGAGVSFASTSYGGGYIVEWIGFRPLFLLGSFLGVAAIALFVFAFGRSRGATLRAKANDAVGVVDLATGHDR